MTMVSLLKCAAFGVVLVVAVVLAACKSSQPAALLADGELAYSGRTSGAGEDEKRSSVAPKASEIPAKSRDEEDEENDEDEGEDDDGEERLGGPGGWESSGVNPFDMIELARQWDNLTVERVMRIVGHHGARAAAVVPVVWSDEALAYEETRDSSDRGHVKRADGSETPYEKSESESVRKIVYTILPDFTRATLAVTFPAAAKARLGVEGVDKLPKLLAAATGIGEDRIVIAFLPE